MANNYRQRKWHGDRSVGAAILGAKVTATNIETNVSSIAETNSDGVYSMRFLQSVTTRSRLQQRVSDRSFEPFALEQGRRQKWMAKWPSQVHRPVQVTENLAPLLNTEAVNSVDVGFVSHRQHSAAGRNFSGLTIFTPGA